MPTGSTKAHSLLRMFPQEGRPLAAFLLAASVAMLAMLCLSARADAAGSLRVSCGVYATNNVDPIRGATHDHRQFGNTSTTNESTWNSLRNNKATSCANAPYLTSAGWYPVERNEPNTDTILYYRAPGDKTKVNALPNGLQLIATKPGVSYDCGSSPGDTMPSQSTPPYGCTQNWSTHVRFPACWSGKGLTPEHTAYGTNNSRTNCPSTHPHRIVEVNFTITHKNFDGAVPNPLMVSTGTNSWGSWTGMHGDYFFAAQDQFNHNVDLDGDGRIEPYDNDSDGRYEPWDADGDSEKALSDLCMIQSPATLEYANSRCRPEGALPSHIRQMHNYYDGKPVPTNRPETFLNPPTAPYPYPTPSTTSPVSGTHDAH